MKSEFPNNIKFAKLLLETDSLYQSESTDLIDFEKVILDAIKRAIEHWDFILQTKAVVGSFSSRQGKPTSFEKTSLKINTDNDTQLITFKITSVGNTDIAEIKFDLKNVTKIFAAKASVVVNELFKIESNESQEGTSFFVTFLTAKMLILAFEKLEKRSEIMLSSFLNEAALHSIELWYETDAKNSSLTGIRTKPLRIFKEKESLFKTYQEQLRSLWKNESEEKILNQKKLILATQYKKVIEHWKLIEKLQCDGKEWRRYVKAGDMSDITDDLIEMFEKTNDLSWVALEHAARRARLYNIYKVNDTNLKKRANRAKASGYGRAQLFRLKKQGEKLLEEMDINSRSQIPEKFFGIL